MLSVKITEHRDPYSFYWQLEKLRRAEQEPARQMPPADYVLEEEAMEEEEEDMMEVQEVEQWPEPEKTKREQHELPQQQFMSPDSGVHLMEREREEEVEEQTYTRPAKIIPVEGMCIKKRKCG